jgi:beta-D-xylosidase 4
MVWLRILRLHQIKDPRWGRGGTETFSEDAFHTSQMVTEYVKGLQGDHPTIRKLSATCKHTFGYQQENWQPSGDYRQWLDARAASHNNISAQDLARYYLKPFEACIEAGTAGMMCTCSKPIHWIT